MRYFIDLEFIERGQDGNHNALLGAKTVKQRWEYLNSIAPDFSPTQFMGKVAKGLGAEVILP